MVIDKTTGRGCAWSIASKTITKKLIAEGIVDKTIFIKAWKNGYDLLRVTDCGENCAYLMSQRTKELTGQPLWAPSFIAPEIWGKAVSRCQNYGKLGRNVEMYLLPEMSEYLRSIPDIELISMTREFLIKHGVVNKPIRQHAGKTYYFNESVVYSLDEQSQMFPYEGRMKFNTFQVRGETCFNRNVWIKAASRFEIGMTLEACIEIFLNTELTHKAQQELSPIDRLVQHIGPPTYERVPENKDEAAFDHIRVIVGLPRYQFYSWEALQNEVKKYQREIYQQVIQRLEKDRQFKKYGVPVNFLKISNVTLLRDFSLEFIFELKE